MNVSNKKTPARWGKGGGGSFLRKEELRKDRAAVDEKYNRSEAGGYLRGLPLMDREGARNGRVKVIMRDGVLLR